MAFVQGQTRTAISSPQTLVMSSAVTVGNVMLVPLVHSYLGCAPVVTDNLGNTYTSVGANVTFPGQGFTWLFVAPITTGGACTVTITYPCGNLFAGYALEYSGISASPYDTTAVGSSNSANPLSGPSITTANANELLLTLWIPAGTSTITATGGGTTRVTDPSSSGSIQDMVVASAGSAQATATNGSAPSGFPITGASWAVKQSGGTVRKDRFFLGS